MVSVSIMYERATSFSQKVFFLAFLMVASIGCSSTEQTTTNSEPFSGAITASQLIAEYPQFRTAYEQYQPSSDELMAMSSLSGKSLVVLFGTWCHDSEREVPRLLKLLDSSGVKLASLSLHAVNYNKQEPNNLHTQYDLQFSPTIILLQNNKEIGRIVEKPIISLGKDLAGFVAE